MTRLLPSLLLLMLSAMFALPGHAENELAGYWQHESEPVWIEMQPETGQGVMLRNDNRPDRVGFLVVTDLEASDEPNEWSAQVFAARLGEYRQSGDHLIVRWTHGLHREGRIYAPLGGVAACIGGAASD